MKQLRVIEQPTFRESVSLDKYLREVSKYSLIKPDEEVLLSQKIRNGDLQAFTTLINANLRFVISVAKQYQNQGLTLSDLISEGNLGLIKAAERFDETKGFKFISYAVWWIRQSVLQALAEKARIVRLPVHKIGSYNKIIKAFKTLEQEYQREPGANEIGDMLNMNPVMVDEILSSIIFHDSMDAPGKDEHNNEESRYDVMMINDSAPPDDRLDNDSVKYNIEMRLNLLTGREATILRYFYGLNTDRSHSLSEIGELLDLTSERVRQIKERAIKKLQTFHQNETLKTYFA